MFCPVNIHSQQFKQTNEKSFKKRILKTVYLFTNVKFINSEIFRKQKEELLNYLKTHFLDFD